MINKILARLRNFLGRLGHFFCVRHSLLPSAKGSLFYLILLDKYNGRKIEKKP